MVRARSSLSPFPPSEGGDLLPEVTGAAGDATLPGWSASLTEAEAEEEALSESL